MTTTPHNAAKVGEIAKTVLMPGDPLRAKWIAENFLEDIMLVNTLRGMNTYTGTYISRFDRSEQAKVTIMASGMGMPSIGIYSYELYSVYDVDNIIRTGTAGAYDESLEIGSLVLAEAAYSESTFAKVQNNESFDTLKPTLHLNTQISKTASEMGLDLSHCTVHSSDVFYQETNPDPEITPYWQEFAARGIGVVEMESFALFHNANVLGKNAACLLTVSNSFASGVEMNPRDRETSLHNMTELALESAIFL